MLKNGVMKCEKSKRRRKRPTEFILSADVSSFAEGEELIFTNL